MPLSITRLFLSEIITENIKIKASILLYTTPKLWNSLPNIISVNVISIHPIPTCSNVCSLL